MSALVSEPADIHNCAFRLVICGVPLAVPSDMWRPAKGTLVPIPTRPLVPLIVTLLSATDDPAVYTYLNF